MGGEVGGDREWEERGDGDEEGGRKERWKS